jgi:hypothetical protein
LTIRNLKHNLLNNFKQVKSFSIFISKKLERFFEKRKFKRKKESEHSIDDQQEELLEQLPINLTNKVSKFQGEDLEMLI